MFHYVLLLKISISDTCKEITIFTIIHSSTFLGTHALEMAAAIAEQSQSTTTDGGVKESQEYEEVIEDLSVQDPEADSSHYMAILVECLSTLNKIPEAVKVCAYVMLVFFDMVVKLT